MLELNDGSMLVAVNNGSSLFGSTSAQLLRFVDSNRDGSADGPPTVLASGLPGLVTSVRRLDDIVVALSAKSGQETITLLRASPTATSPLSTIGSLRFDFPSGFEHSSYAISLRRSPTSSQTLEIFFNLGAKANSLSTTERVGLQGDGININMDRVLLEADSVHRLKLTPNPQKSSLTGTVDLIARGLRNAAGMVFSANGDLYLQDNGIDGDPRDISFSADELNYIPFQQIGQVIPNFGFPNSYIDSVTGLQVNNNATSRQPLLAFLPIAGRRSEGLTELAFAPPGFGEPFRSGVFASFIGMVGKGGANNLENPIIFADLTKREYYHFIPNQLLGNPYGLTSTSNSLYISDLSSTGSLRDNTKGIVYCITPKKVFTSAAITNVTDNVGPIQGSVPNGGRTDDTTPTITGTISAPLPAGETLSVYNGTTLLGSATVNNTARTWSYTPGLTATAGTTYSITARVADAAGILGSTSAARTFVLDTTAPTTSAAITNVSDNAGIIQGSVANGGRTDDTTPTITGTISAPLPAGESLRVYNGTTLLGSATVNNTARTWSYTPSLPATAGTTYSITARVADAAGNLGPTSAARTFVLDSIAPTTTAAITNVADNVGPIQGSVAAGGRTDDRTPTITGTISTPLPAGESLRVYNGTTLLGSATVNNTARTWSYTPSLPATAGTTYSITARVADAAGNLGSTSAARTFLIENAWSYNWLNASNLANTPGVLRANVKVASPRSNEPALNVNALRVDLQTPGLRLISTPRMDNWQADTRETISQTTRDFITGSRQQGIPVVAAINTAFFDLVDGTKSLPTNLLGLAVSNNTLVSPSQHNYPYFAVDSISGARIERNPSITPDLKTTTVAFAGMTNGIVLWDGIINGPNSDLNARTAIGLSSDRRYLFLTTVDRSVRSVSPSISYWGATIADMGFLLSGFGASSGLNLDGGGSTYMAWWDSGSKSAQLLNAPLIGAERTVGTNLGIAYLSPSAV
jgi:hypothetical protein